MTTKPKAQKFRIRRDTSTASPADPAPSEPTETAEPPVQQPVSGAVDSADTVSAETDIDAIRQEGLTGRQLRMARRVAQKTGLAVTSDFDAVRQLRQHLGDKQFGHGGIRWGSCAIVDPERGLPSTRFFRQTSLPERKQTR